MMTGVLGRIIGRVESPEREALGAQFGFLESIERGLSEKVVEYVESGEGRVPDQRP